jgi:hypothetical protein
LNWGFGVLGFWGFGVLGWYRNVSGNVPDELISDSMDYFAHNPHAMDDEEAMDIDLDPNFAPELESDERDMDEYFEKVAGNDWDKEGGSGEKKKPFPSWMMSTEFLDTLKSKITTSHVVATRVALKRKPNGREYHGLSPFKSERTPSFFVNDAKGKWFDFSSGQAGDMFDFVMKTDGYSFVGAILRVMRQIGFTIPRKGESMKEYLTRQEKIKRSRKNK